MNNHLIELQNKLEKLDWKKLPLKSFTKDVVESLNMIGAENLEQIILSLNNKTFKALQGRLWKEQCPDVNGSAFPEDNDQFYYDTLPMVILLERIIRFRLPVCDDNLEKNSMMQQLAMLKIILKPNTLKGLVKNDDEENDDEEDDEEEDDEEEDEYCDDDEEDDGDSNYITVCDNCGFEIDENDNCKCCDVCGEDTPDKCMCTIQIQE